MDQWRRWLRGMDGCPGGGRDAATAVKPSAVFSGITVRSASLRRCDQALAVARCADQETDDENNLIVFAMNGQPLPNIHGFPIRR